MGSIGPGWTDHSTSHIAGLFPLAVERYYNSAMAAHAPAVTTVTATARYYALHGLVAQSAVERKLDREQAQETLRRAEAAMALVSLAHASTDEHRDGGTIHGTEKLSQQVTIGNLDLAEVTRPGGTGYAKGAWGFWGAYRGSEIRLRVVDDRDFVPGSGFDAKRAGSDLDDLLELARQATLTTDELLGASGACICAADTSADGQWIAELFAGRPGAGESIGGRQHQTMAVIAAALAAREVRDARDVAAFIKYDPLLLDHPTLAEMPAARVWRGLCFRADSVDAWRRLWASVCAEVGSVTTREHLRDWLADKAPAGSLREFAASLPKTTLDGIAPRDAEAEVAQLGLDPDIASLAVILLGGHRYRELADREMLGFRGQQGLPAATEELSPAWVDMMIAEWRDREMRDFCAHLVDVMVNRSQRIALMKSRFDLKTGRFTMPARVRVHDDHVVKLFNENASRPAFLVAQLLSLGTQLGIFAIDGSGRRVAGDRIGVLDGAS